MHFWVFLDTGRFYPQSPKGGGNFSVETACAVLIALGFVIVVFGIGFLSPGLVVVGISTIFLAVISYLVLLAFDYFLGELESF